VVQVSVGKADQDHLAIGVVAMIGPFTQFRSQGCFRCHLPHDDDVADALTSAKPAHSKQPKALDSRWPYLYGQILSHAFMAAGVAAV
jgi:hypothetical protein